MLEEKNQGRNMTENNLIIFNNTSMNNNFWEKPVIKLTTNLAVSTSLLFPLFLFIRKKFIFLNLYL